MYLIFVRCFLDRHYTNKLYEMIELSLAVNTQMEAWMKSDEVAVTNRQCKVFTSQVRFDFLNNMALLENNS